MKNVKQQQYVFTAKEIMARGSKKTPMLIEDLLQKNGLACLTGSSDVGKSFLGLFLSTILCGEKDEIFNRKVNRKTGSVLVICTEDTADDICVRLTNFSPSNKIDGDKLRFIFDTTNLLSKIKATLGAQPADLVVLDTFGDLYPDNLNDSIQVRRYLKPFKELANDTNSLFLFTHHIGKGKEFNATPSKNDVLGSQGIESACRTVLNLRKKEDGKRILTIVKGNHISEKHKNSGIILSFDIEKGFEATGDVISYAATSQNSNVTKPIINEIVDLYSELKSYKKVAEALKEKGHQKIDKNKVGVILKQQKQSGQSPKENDGRTEAA